jgi:flagellar protein FliO/FliZ
MIELVIRLVFSLAVVVGMLLLLAKFSSKRLRGGSGSLVRVVQRQPLSRTSSVAVVTVGSRVLVLGTTEQQVQLLTELDPDELDVPEAEESPAPVTAVPASVPASVTAPVTAPARRSGAHAAPSRFRRPRRRPAPRQAPRPVAAPAPRPVPALRDADVVAAEGALNGSVLSAQTWKQAFAAATAATTGRDRVAS